MRLTQVIGGNDNSIFEFDGNNRSTGDGRLLSMLFWVLLLEVGVVVRAVDVVSRLSTC